MKKRILSLAVVSTLSLGSLASPNFITEVRANSISDLKNEQQQLNEKRSKINENINTKKSQISELQNEQASIEAQIQKLDAAMKDAQTKISEKDAEITSTQEEIEKLKVEIEELKKRIEQRNEVIKERAHSLQLNGGTISYLDVLFGSQSFGDFVNRVSAVAALANADKDILEQHNKDKQDLETKQKSVEDKLASLEKMRAELEGLRQKLDGQIAEKNKLVEKLEQEEQMMHAEVMEESEQAAIIASQEAAIQKAIQLEQQRIAEEEAARKAQEEKQRAEAAAAAAAAGSNKGSGSSSSKPVSSPAVSKPVVSNSAFSWPAAGRVSSGFGNRSGGSHFGIDIAQSGGNVPITAAASGVVIRANYSSSYGNVVYISHSINGQVYTTVYAHMKSDLKVSSGQVVSKGQRIGTMGNTGQSFGQHLHFEIHKGPWTASKSNAVNPMSYLP